MFQCEVQGISCLENDYDKFDAICTSELSQLISVDEIINKSDFCTSLAIDLIEKSIDDDFLNVNECLAGLNGKLGVYHLWVEVGHCQDHEKHSLLCTYVGKGHVKNRIVSHIKRKWPESEMLYVTFYECTNRIAKYIEQLFLDTYKFYLNTDENSGVGSLYARWSEERFLLGTEIQNMADIQSKKWENEKKS